MKTRWIPVFVLMFITPILTELLSTNMSASAFFHPYNLVMLMTLGYGFPILIIREIMVRKKLGLTSLFLLGIIYGLYNEGIIAKTLFLGGISPIPNLAEYGLILGVRVPWAIIITVWHALHAVIYPIVFTYIFFPDVKESWIGKKTAWTLGLIIFLFGTINFFSFDGEIPAGSLAHYIFLLSSIAVLFIASIFWPKKPELIAVNAGRSLKLISLGVVGYMLTFFIPLAIADIPINPFLLSAYLIITLAIALILLTFKETISIGSAVQFGIGNEIAFLLFVLLTSFGNPETLLTTLVLLIGFIIFLHLTHKKRSKY